VTAEPEVTWQVRVQMLTSGLLADVLDDHSVVLPIGRGTASLLRLAAAEIRLLVGLVELPCALADEADKEDTA
jgi:hypothetical protein